MVYNRNNGGTFSYIISLKSQLTCSHEILIHTCSKVVTMQFEKKMSSLQSWVSEHKLASVGTLWASAIGASLAYSKKRSAPLKPSLKLIHARMHAQALTLAVLSGAAIMHYYEAKRAEEDDGKKLSTDVIA